ncbi:DUF89 family protein [bacterium]|nr:DUF89 family protein [bacterium]
MKTFKECIPCFLKQAENTLTFIEVNDADRDTIISRANEYISDIDCNLTPPEISRGIYHIVSNVTGIEDLFKNAKIESNKVALSLYPHLKDILSKSKDRMLTAVKLAVVGNTIDYGTRFHSDGSNDIDIEDEIKKIMESEFDNTNSFFDIDEFKDKLLRAKNVLYIGDNAGEIVFDKVLIEEMSDKDVTFVVRSRPAINDILLEDAKTVGMDSIARVIESGSDFAGTIPEKSTPEFQEAFDDADIIISKGQGNFETLDVYPDKPIFFILRVKCPVVAAKVGLPVGSVILMDTQKHQN